MVEGGGEVGEVGEKGGEVARDDGFSNDKSAEVLETTRLTRGLPNHLGGLVVVRRLVW